MMLEGEERLFRTDVLPLDQKYCEFPLAFCGSEEPGLKMRGYFPRLWDREKNELTGPILFDDDYSYVVIKVDYEQCCIWMQRV